MHGLPDDLSNNHPTPSGEWIRVNELDITYKMPLSTNYNFNPQVQKAQTAWDQNIVLATAMDQIFIRLDDLEFKMQLKTN